MPLLKIYPTKLIITYHQISNQISNKSLDSQKPFNSKELDELRRNNLFKITKEYAEIFNINYQISPNYYLIDIGKFMNIYTKPQFINTNLLCLEKENIPGVDSIYSEYEKRLESYQKSILSDMERKWKFQLC